MDRMKVLNKITAVSKSSLLTEQGLSPSVADITDPNVLEASPHQRSTTWIGVSGAPASGKTTFADLLSFIMTSSTKVTIIHQDDYQQPKHLLIPADPTDLKQDSDHD